MMPHHKCPISSPMKDYALIALIVLRLRKSDRFLPTESVPMGTNSLSFGRCAGAYTGAAHSIADLKLAAQSLPFAQRRNLLRMPMH
jgi:hypothetical protein